MLAFRDAAPEIQEKEYCHRFTLARRICGFSVASVWSFNPSRSDPIHETSSPSGLALVGAPEGRLAQIESDGRDRWMYNDSRFVA